MWRLVRTDLFVRDVASQVDWFHEETGLDEIFAAKLAQRFAAAVEETLEFLFSGRPRVVRFPDLNGYRGFNLFEPFGRFRIYYRVIGDELHAERLLEGHRMAASDDRQA